MNTTLGFIADIKARYNIESDYAAAKLLEVSKMTVSSYRNGKSLFSDEIALKVADLLDLDPAYVVASIHAEREKNLEVKKVWSKLAEKLSVVAGVLIVVSVALLLPDLEPMNALHDALAGRDHCILCQITADYWYLTVPLLALLLLAFPLHNPRNNNIKVRG